MSETKLKTEGSARNYWAQIFTLKTWQEFVDSGAAVTGFRSTRWGLIQQIKPGDLLLCYVSGIGKWIGILEVLSPPYLDKSPIWKDELFPCRADVKTLLALTPETAIQIRTLRDRLSIFRKKKWGLYLISSPSKWNASDAEVVIEAMHSTNDKVSH